MPSHLGIHHVALFVSDFEKAKHFYIELLGYKIEWEPDENNVYLTACSDNLALHRGHPPNGKQRLDHIGILVKEQSDVKLWEDFLRAHKVKIVATTKQHRDGAVSCYIEDPCGTVIQILYHPPLSQKNS